MRAVAQPDDTELLTRHEVQASPPDLLVTNYSMLEYMLMRPIERSIFDSTRDWLAENPEEKIMVVLDEAHLYRGAAGAEVGLLLRRLRDRLSIPPERFQVICATASFSEQDYAPEFGGQLAGVPSETFEAVTGDLDLRPHAAAGSERDAEVLASINLERFYSPIEADREAAIGPLLEYRSVAAGEGRERDLFKALADFPALGLLVNTTMKAAAPVAELGGQLFPDSAPQQANTAVTALMACGSVARAEPKSPGLLPCRVHNFFRGLPGLWVCMNPTCAEVPASEQSGICGRMYSQPHERCGCGARILEFYTCRNCGSAYARAYSDDIDSPNALWPEPGRRLRMPGGEASPLLPLDLLLEEPRETDNVEPADYDLETGRINPPVLGPRTRTVHIRKDRITPAVDEEGNTDTRVETLWSVCAVSSLWREGAFWPFNRTGPSNKRGSTIPGAGVTPDPTSTAGPHPKQSFCAPAWPQGAGVLRLSSGRGPSGPEPANVFRAGFAQGTHCLGLPQAPGLVDAEAYGEPRGPISGCAVGF